MTEEQKQQALANATRAYNGRVDRAKNIRSNSFKEWGNAKCISRLYDTIEAMERGTASERQYKYWQKH
ncbi:MAG TPA: hypothetical protein VEL31_09680 [Ktedonobacteraceae bacterium]|nr:hypothetical protein [Ktedonobacteraceae bacterium]